MINLTTQEQKLVAKIRKRQNHLRRFRLWIICLMPLLIIFWGCIFVKLISLRNELPESIYQLTYASFIPIIIVNCCLCAFLFGKYIRDWNGNAVDTLILKLIDERTDEPTKS